MSVKITLENEHYDSVCVPKIDMARERNKPTQSWMERAKIEIEHEEELTIERAYELGKIRGEKEQKAEYDSQLPLIKETYYNAGYETAKNKTIDKACDWLISQNLISRCIVDDVAFVKRFKKAMEE